ncbi:MotA/TolQ/ExbB proton channel family protein [Halalkalibacter urbisdiaboli]|uniref:MotA/TolQ/ExbB proton channel family protein n=1 Tax=Halalkalibacter urbisdiaboli TaxID=1960589 RepID=UPI000B42D405|nr:MotA/TolQ/ExbB proton channel family protein [Halalkalibacter urbisdiaboli]
MEFLLSNLVIFITITLLCTIVTIAVIQNQKIYSFIRKQNNAIDSSHASSELLRDIEKKFNDKSKKTENKINIQSFIEEYMTEFKMPQNKTTIVQKLKLIQMTVSLSILVGVLGTFIGLVIALSGINSEQMGESITNVLDGVHTAFYTSIAGILCSIIINLWTKMKNSEQQLIQVMLRVENYLNLKESRTLDHKLVDAMGDVKAAIQEMNQSFVDIQTFSISFEKATKNMNEFNGVFSDNTQKLQNVFGNMELFTESYNNHMDQLNVNFEKVLSFFEKQEEIQSYSVDLMQQTSKHMGQYMSEQTNIQAENREAITSANESMSKIGQEIEQYFSVQSEKQHDAFEAMSSFYEDSLKRQSELVESQRKIEMKNSALIENVEQATNTMKDILENSSFEHLGRLTKIFTENMQEIHEQTKQMMNYFQNVDALQKQYQDYYLQVVQHIEAQTTNQKQHQAEFSEYLSQILSQNKEVQGTFTETVDLFKSFDNNNTEVVNEMKKLILHTENIVTDGTELFKKQSEELQQSLKQFSDLSTKELKRLLEQLDDSLGKGVKDSINQFKTYVDVTNKIIKEQLSSMINLYDSHLGTNDLSIRSLDKTMVDLNKSINGLNEHLINQKNNTIQDERYESKV